MSLLVNSVRSVWCVPSMSVPTRLLTAQERLDGRLPLQGGVSPPERRLCTGPGKPRIVERVRFCSHPWITMEPKVVLLLNLREDSAKISTYRSLLRVVQVPWSILSMCSPPVEPMQHSPHRFSIFVRSTYRN